MRNSVRAAGIAVVFALGAGVAPAHAQKDVPALWTIRGGSHPIGFTTIARFDSTRTSHITGGPRPIQIALWYPAKKNNAAARMTFGDYFRLTASELKPGSAADEAKAVADFKKFLGENGTGPDVVDTWFGSTVAAVRDAVPDKAAPLVLIAQGNAQSPYDQALLAEYLASEGFTVASMPSTQKIDGQLEKQSIFETASDEMKDLTFVLNALQTDARVKPGIVGLIGHSFGARAAFLMLKDPRVKGLVSLDGGIANAQGSDWLQGSGFSPPGLRTPIMHFYQNVDSIVRPDFTMIGKMSGADRTMVLIDDMHHIHFTSLGNISGLIPGAQFGPPTPDVLKKIDIMYRLLDGFLHAYIDNEASMFPNSLPRFVHVTRMTVGTVGGAQ